MTIPTQGEWESVHGYTLRWEIPVGSNTRRYRLVRDWAPDDDSMNPIVWDNAHGGRDLLIAILAKESELAYEDMLRELERHSHYYEKMGEHDDHP